MWKIFLLSLIFIVTIRITFILYHVYIPEDYEGPTFYRLITIIMSLGGSSVRFVNRLTSIPEPYLTRVFTNYYPFTRPFHVQNDRITFEDLFVAGTTVRVYSSKQKLNLDSPVIIFIHGGAFFTFNVEFYNTYLYELASRTDLKIFAIEYGLAPEHPFPSQLNECQKVIEYLIENSKEYQIDVKKIILAGDSSGGNLVAALSQRLALKDPSLIKLQILLSPFLQLHNYIHPSAFEYETKTYFTTTGLHHGRVLLWYLGITNYTKELSDEIASESLIYQIEDLKLRKSYIDRMSPALIPREFTEAKSYYKTYIKRSLNFFNLNTKLNGNHIFKRDEHVASLAKAILSSDMSPGLVDDEKMKRLPKTYIVVCEWDPLKDPELIYAQRLRNNGVQVKIAYYDKAAHGSHFLSFAGFRIAQRIMDDLVEFLKENEFSL